VRPLDAYGALQYLHTRSDVVPGQIGLQGWSNGGSAVLSALVQVAADTPGAAMHQPTTGFRAALAFYPGCGLKGVFADGYLPYASVRVLQGDADEEVSPKLCAALVKKSRARGGDIEMTLYPGATHDFDDPGRRRQSVEANRIAKADAVVRAQAFFAAQLQER
jgi:dienelactone hydrolase